MKELMIEMRFPLGFLLPQKRDTGPCPNKWNVSVALKSARSIPGEEHVCRRCGYAVLCSACALPPLWGGVLQAVEDLCFTPETSAWIQTWKLTDPSL
jgi:hypothetical protein